MTSGGFRILALGPLRAEGPDGPLRGEWLEQRPGQLLRLLVCERRRVLPAEEIGEALWPHAGPAAAGAVRHAVHALRRRLEPWRLRGSNGSVVICRSGGYRLDPRRVWIDADEFEQQAGDGLRALRERSHGDAERCLQRAVALYRADFLADEPCAEWAFGERERLRGIACDALRALVSSSLGDPEARARHLEELAELEPFDDDVHIQLISAWLRLGRWSRAARHYASFRARLLREFGAVPGFDLSQLARDCAPRRCG